MKAIIKELEKKIEIENAGNLDKCQEHYVAGLSDALNMIISHLKDEYIVGNSYYVLMPQDDYLNTIIKMRLYKITQKNKYYYSFTKSPNFYHPTNDLTLSNPNSLKLRVYKTKQEAEINIDNNIWRMRYRKDD